MSYFYTSGTPRGLIFTSKHSLWSLHVSDLSRNDLVHQFIAIFYFCYVGMNKHNNIGWFLQHQPHSVQQYKYNTYMFVRKTYMHNAFSKSCTLMESVCVLSHFTNCEGANVGIVFYFCFFLLSAWEKYPLETPGEQS